jgi:asparagine synthase (glutamine-hydrolysing)
MCGIAGIISLDERTLDFRSLVEMADKISHRGPDGQGFLFTNAADFCNSLKSERPDARIICIDHKQNITLGHRWLSILDHNPNAAQPMSDKTGRYWIVYNGEIYNHVSLRKELENKGYIFCTDHSDTEVIINAYDYWGSDCLQKLNGMWAFCIWDTKQNTLFLARDRMGKKPLYYTETGGNFVFASELKALMKFPGISKSVNERSVYDYLTYSMVPSPETIFANVKKLPAAHFILFTPGEKLKVKQYWTPLGKTTYINDNEDQIRDDLREKLEEATRIRLIADVEVGILLSGGLDSSVILANASKFVTKPVKAFSVGFENNSHYKNEFKYAKKVAQHFNTDYHELIISERDFIDFIPNMAYFQDEPMSDPASIAIYYISKMAQNHNVKVLLSGEGSDELLVGYELWRLANQFSNLIDGKTSLARMLGFIHGISPFKNKRRYYHDWYRKIIQGYPVFWSGTEILNENEKQFILNKEFFDKIENYNSFLPLKDLYSVFKSMPNKIHYDWMISVDLLNRLPDLLLSRLDRMSMAASVESRNPFLDVNVVEYAMRIPPRLKNKGNQQKYILKKAYEGILPHEIIYRPKDSFQVPLQKMFRNNANRDYCLSAIESFNSKTNIFRGNYIDKLRTTQDMNVFWNISNLAFWYAKFKE